MNITQILESGANVSFTINALDLKEWMLELVEEQRNRSTQPAKERLLSPKEASCKLHVDLSTLWRWDKAGYLKKVKLGNKAYYRMSDINKLMEG